MKGETDTPMEHNIENRKRFIIYSQMIFDKGIKSINEEEKSSKNNTGITG